MKKLILIAGTALVMGGVSPALAQNGEPVGILLLEQKVKFQLQVTGQGSVSEGTSRIKYKIDKARITNKDVLDILNLNRKSDIVVQTVLWGFDSFGFPDIEQSIVAKLKGESSGVDISNELWDLLSADAMEELLEELFRADDVDPIAELIDEGVIVKGQGTLKNNKAKAKLTLTFVDDDLFGLLPYPVGEVIPEVFLDFESVFINAKVSLAANEKKVQIKAGLKVKGLVHGHGAVISPVPDDGFSEEPFVVKGKVIINGKSKLSLSDVTPVISVDDGG